MAIEIPNLLHAAASVRADLRFVVNRGFAKVERMHHSPDGLVLTLDVPSGPTESVALISPRTFYRAFVHHTWVDDRRIAVWAGDKHGVDFDICVFRLVG